MTLMVVSMVDTMLWGERLLSAIGWAVALGGAAITALLTQRDPLGVERATHVGLMAFLTTGMGIAHGSGGPGGGQSVHGHMNHAHVAATAGIGLGPQILIFIAAFLAITWGVVLLGRAAVCVDPGHRDKVLICGEKVLSAVSLLAMSSSLVVM